MRPPLHRPSRHAPRKLIIPLLHKLRSFALDANVRQLVIGHFSARYEDESVLLHEASAIFPQTILAKENLCIDVDGGTVYEK